MKWSSFQSQFCHALGVWYQIEKIATALVFLISSNQDSGAQSQSTPACDAPRDHALKTQSHSKALWGSALPVSMSSVCISGRLKTEPLYHDEF